MGFDDLIDTDAVYSPQLALDMIQHAVKHDQLAAMEVKGKDGKTFYAVCAIVNDEDGSARIWPLARIFDNDPFEECLPPDGCELIDKRGPVQ